MAERENTIFREKNLKKATDPEALNGYLKVTSFRAWFIVVAAGLVLAAIFVWSFFGKVIPVIQGAGYCINGSITCYFNQKHMDELVKGAKVDIEGNEGTITQIEKDLFMARDVPYEVLYLLPDDGAVWYSIANIKCDLVDGLYTVKYKEDEIRPFSFLTQGNEDK